METKPKTGDKIMLDGQEVTVEKAYEYKDFFEIRGVNASGVIVHTKVPKE